MSLNSPRFVLSHSIVAPQVTITPSSAYSTLSPALQPTVVTIPCCEGFGSGPIFIKIEEPVPNVAFAIPGPKQPSPNAAACESPIIAVTGIVLGSKPPKSVSPKCEEDD